VLTTLTLTSAHELKPLLPPYIHPLKQGLYKTFGKKKLLFYIYAVIVKQKIYKRATIQ